MLLPFEGKFNLKINKIMKQLLIYVVAMMAALFAAMFVHAEEESGLAKQMAVAEQAVVVEQAAVTEQSAVVEQAVAEQAVAAEQAAVIEQTAVTEQETISAQATAVQQPMGMTLRIGNSYIVNQNVMNSRAYMGYLQNTSPEVYGRFKSGYVTAMTASVSVLQPWAWEHSSQASPVWGLAMEGCTGVQTSIISIAPTSPPPIGRFNPAPMASASLCISDSTFASKKLAAWPHHIFYLRAGQTIGGNHRLFSLFVHKFSTLPPLCLHASSLHLAFIVLANKLDTS